MEEQLMELDSGLFFVSGTLIIGALIVFIIAYLAAKSWKTSPQDSENEQFADQNGQTSTEKHNRDAKKPKKKVPEKQFGQTFSHPWLASNLKGHSGRVLDIDFSANGRHLVSCGEDRTLMLWNVKDFLSKEHKSVRGNIELDHAKLVRFAPDSKSLILSLVHSNQLCVYKLVRKEDTGNYRFLPVEGVEFAKAHVQEILNIGIACSGKFILSASHDDRLVVWDLRGKILKTIETKHNSIYCAIVSPCGRFIASGGFTPDVKVWQVKFAKNGEFQDVTRAFELTGHTSGIHCFDFNQDSTRMVSVSKDGTYRLYNTDIKFEFAQDPYLIRSGQFPPLKNATAQVQVRLAPNGETFAISIGASLGFFLWDSESDEPDQWIDDVHTEPLTTMRFSPDNRYLITAGDKHIRVLHNASGYKAAAKKYREEQKTVQGDAHKERLKQQAKEAEMQYKQIVAN